MRHAVLWVLVLFMASCADKMPLHSDFDVGATRDEISSRFGKPARIRSLIKQGQAIWGPIEEYWDQVPNGSAVEIWSYRSRITLEGAGEYHLQSGETELYFIDASDTVSAIGFHLDGAVYEGNRPDS